MPESLDKTLTKAEASAEARGIELKFPNATRTFNGKDYLLTFVLPKFYFHYTTAYVILRHTGVQVGKRDFPGG